MDRDWDPLQEDYDNHSFNRYRTGPGRNLPPGHGQNSGKSRASMTSELFVSNIPGDMSYDGLSNLFSKYGELINVNIIPAKGRRYTFGFVMFKSLTHAENARQDLDGYEVDPKLNLKVSYARPKEPKSHMPPEVAHEDSSSDLSLDASFHEEPNTARRMSYGRGKQISQNTMQKWSERPGNRNQAGNYGASNNVSPVGRNGNCQYCNKLANLRRCTGCYKVWYCSRACQTDDWYSVHQEQCQAMRDDDSLSANDQLNATSSNNSLHSHFNRSFEQKNSMNMSKNTGSQRQNQGRRPQSSCGSVVSDTMQVPQRQNNQSNMPRQNQGGRSQQNNMRNMSQQDHDARNMTQQNQDARQPNNTRNMSQRNQDARQQNSTRNMSQRNQDARQQNNTRNMSQRNQDAKNMSQQDQNARQQKKAKNIPQQNQDARQQNNTRNMHQQNQDARQQDNSKNMPHQDQDARQQNNTRNIPRQNQDSRQQNNANSSSQQNQDGRQPQQNMNMKNSGGGNQRRQQQSDSNVNKGASGGTQRFSNARQNNEKHAQSSEDFSIPMINDLVPVTFSDNRVQVIFQVADHWNNIYVQFAASSKFINSLLQMTAEHCSKPQTNTPSINDVKVDQIWCAKWSDDNWYRSRILTVKNKEITVQFIDFGNIDKIAVNDLRFIDKTLSTFPPQALCVGIHGVQPADGKKWCIPSLQLLSSISEKPFYVKSICAQNNRNLVDIFENLKSAKNYGDVLVEKGFAVRTGAAKQLNNNNSHKNQNQGARPKTKSDDRKAKQQNGVHEPPRDNKKHNEPMKKANKVEQKKSAESPVARQQQQSNAMDAESLLKMLRSGLNAKDDGMKNLIDSCKKGDEINFMIFVDNQIDAWAMVLIPEMLDMTTSLQEDKETPSSFKPSRGQFVAALSIDACEWYRARIQKVLQSSYIVYSIDFGNFEQVNQVRPLTDTELQIPAGAMRLSLTNTNNASEGLFQVNEKYSGKVKERRGNQIIIDCEIGGKVCEVCCSPELPVVSDLYELQVEVGKEYDATVFNVYDLHGINFVLNDYLEVLTEATEVFNSYCEGISNSNYKAMKDEVIFGLFEGAWSRASVFSVTDEGNYKVQFIDFGNLHELKADEARCMPLRFMKIPKLSIECSLCNTNDLQLSEDMLAYIMEKPMVVKIVRMSNDILFVEMREEDGKLMLERLREMSAKEQSTSSTPIREENSNSEERHPPELEDPLPPSANWADSVPDLESSSNASTQEELKEIEATNPVLHVYRYTDCNCVKPPLNGEIQLIVMHMKSPDIIYCKLLDSSGSDDRLDKLNEEINVFCDKLPTESLYSPVPAEVCFAMYPDDGLWYRAVCIESDSEACSILFADFGDIKPIPRNRIRKLVNKDFLAEPFQAFHCQLNGVVPVNDEDWSEDDIEGIADQIELPSIFNATVIEEVNDIYVIDIPELKQTLLESNIAKEASLSSNS